MVGSGGAVRRWAGAAVVAMALVACTPARNGRPDGGDSPPYRPTAADVAEGRRTADRADGADWRSYGRTYDESHESPLRQIDRDTVKRLGLTAAVDLGPVPNAGTTPLAVGGIVYFTVGQSIVRAVDARSGRQLWMHDPEVAKVAGRKLRYGWGPRGIAYWDGRLYVGTTDGRLIALDARDGHEVWSAQTTEGEGDGRYISGAPRAFDGLVLIGHGGADYSPVRGYVTAYDAATGQQRWRFNLVPGDPAKGFEDKAQALAARTWTGQWWKYGGGGTAWNALTYDPELDTVYLGTGNGAPWNRKIRSPGGGDNLFLSSIVAVDARTGAYKWHYQIDPGNSWDFNAAMDMALATVRIDGRPRKVLMQAPKNGFFYVIDRETGKPISAGKLGKVTWAEGVDLKTGRPVEAPGARYVDKPALIWPGYLGAHNWAPMAFSTATNRAYVPTIEMPGYYDDSGIAAHSWTYQSGRANLGLKPFVGETDPNAGSSALVAWDVLTQKPAWRVPTPSIWNGGAMVTAGGLVFQGWGDGSFNAFNAENGKRLWRFNAPMGISGAPITFLAKGRQYVAVVAGWGGAGAAYMGAITAGFGWTSRQSSQWLLIFALDGKATLPPAKPLPPVKPIADPAFGVNAARVARGGPLFATTCGICHGSNAIASGYAPDLRASTVPTDFATLKSVLHDGILEANGMPRYAELTDDQIADLQHFIRYRARIAVPKRSAR